MKFSGPVKLLENRDLGNDNWLAVFDAPDIGAATGPAQFVMLRALSGRDPLLGRPFSVARIGRGPRGATVDLLYKVTGRGTALMAGMTAGDEAHMVGPLGHPFPAPASSHGPIFMVAGGIGIAPFPLLAASLRAAGRSSCLLYGARSAADLIARDLMAEAGAEIEVATDDGSEGHRGFVTELLDRRLAGLDDATRASAIAYVCGPTPMMAATEAVVRRHGATGHFSVESTMGCGFGVCLSCVIPVRDAGGEEEGFARICVDGPTFPEGRIVWERSVEP